MSKSRPAALALLLACTAFAAPPPGDVAALGAVFAGGALDLMTEPRRDVTASFGALVSAPIGYPREKRAAVYSFLHLALPVTVRARQAQLSADNPALAALCVQPDGDGRFKLEGLVTGRTRL